MFSILVWQQLYITACLLRLFLFNNNQADINTLFLFEKGNKIIFSEKF